MSGMIKSLLGLSIRDTSSATSSSSASSTDGDCIDHQAASSSLSSNVDSSVKNDNLGKATEIPATAATTSVSEVNKEEDVTLDEEAIKEAVKDYGEQERLAPFRTKQILKKALKPNPPDEPDPSECCGSSCDPCVKDLWREEVRVWKIARGIDPYALSPAIDKADLDW